MKVGKLSIRDKQISIARLFVENVIAHNIAHNLEIDAGFPVHWYIEECKKVLVKTNIPDYLITEILDEAEDKGINEKAPESDGAAQIHPELNSRFIEAVNRLNILFKKAGN